MLKTENAEVIGWEHAIRGMRNPLNSWEKSDTAYWCYPIEGSDFPHYVGDNDLGLMKRLRNAGSDHRKYLRMLTVYVDITAPLYWWKEFDTYKVGTTANSCSTMHKIHAKRFTMADFSCEHLEDIFLHGLRDTVDLLNKARDGYLYAQKEEKPLVPAKDYWWQMIQLLPTSYNQKRTVMLNYEVLTNMYHARKNHKLDEWHTLCDWIESLPYAKELIVGEREAVEHGH